MPPKLSRIPWHLRYRTFPQWASRRRQLVARALHRHADVSFGPHCRVGPGFQLEIPGPGTLRIGRAVDLRRDFVVEISGDGVVEIGDLCVFTWGAVIQCSTKVSIGRGCQIGQNVMIVDGTHKFRDHTKPMQAQGYDLWPITIGDGATIMSKVTIAADIGERAVIGAGSVVTKPIPAYSLAVGSPARVIEYFGPDPN